MSQPAHARPRRSTDLLRAVLVLACGLALAFLVLTDRINLFASPRLLPLFQVTAAALMVVGAWSSWDSLRGHAHADAHPGRRTWPAFLVIPALVVAVAVPLKPLGMLGSRTGGRPLTANRSLAPAKPTTFAPLTGNPAELSTYEYTLRGETAQGRSTLAGKRIAIMGFASQDQELAPNTWVLARLKVWCCVSDALPFMVAMEGPHAGKPPKEGSWFRVIGTPLPAAGNGLPRLQVESYESVPTPATPYLW